MGIYPHKRTPLAERFWRNVEKTDGCWLWTGDHTGDGYGRIAIGGRNSQTRAHRASWLLHYGELPTLCVLHQCDNGLCVRPDHLFLGTRPENTADMVAKRRGRGAPRVITLAERAAIRSEVAAGHLHREVARARGINPATVTKIVNHLHNYRD